MIPKQDRTRVRTPTDIEQKYNLGEMMGDGDKSIKGQERKLKQMNQSIVKVVESLEEQEELVNQMAETVAELGETVSSHESNLSGHIDSESVHISRGLNTNISGSGWYRIAKFENTNINNVKGGSAYGCTISLKRTFSSVNNEMHIIRLDAVHNKSRFTSVSSMCNTQTFTKIRHVYVSGASYIEVYRNRTGVDGLYITIDNARNPRGTWLPMLSATSETVDGMTILSEMSIPYESYGVASTLKTPRKIGNVSFDGSADVALMEQIFSGNATSGTTTKAMTNYDKLLVEGNVNYDSFAFEVVKKASSSPSFAYSRSIADIDYDSDDDVAVFAHYCSFESTSASVFKTNVYTYKAKIVDSPYLDSADCPNFNITRIYGLNY